MTIGSSSVAEMAEALPGSDALRAQRRAAAAALAVVGFPGARNEAWKYTRASAFLDRPYATAAAPDREAGSDRSGALLVDGHLVHCPAERDGLQVAPVTETLPAHQPGDGFDALNLALATGGLFVRVASGSHALVIHHKAATDGVLCAVRHVIEVADGAELVIEEHFEGGGNAFTSSVVTLTVGAGATVTHTRISDEAPGTVHHARLTAVVGERGTYNLASFVFGGATTRIEPVVHLAGEKASTTLHGLAALGAAQHVDHHVTVNHDSPHATSRQTFRSLVDKGRSVFTGCVVVPRGAVGTDSTQVHRALLLSEGGIANARPQLQILADDVKCAHGTAVGALDEEALFYLRQRGLSPLQARALLTRAFALEIVMEAPEALRAGLNARISRFLGEA